LRSDERAVARRNRFATCPAYRERSVSLATPSARLTPTCPDTDSGCTMIERPVPPTNALAKITREA
jgi:hypothetical protein